MPQTLLCWLGNTDLKAAGLRGGPDASTGLGPIAQAVTKRQYDNVVLLSNYPEEEATLYGDWLRTQYPANIRIEPIKLTSPTHFTEIHTAAVNAIKNIAGDSDAKPPLTIHLSPGTPAMQAVWIILAKTRYPFAELIQTSRQAGLETVAIPYDIAAEFVTDLYQDPDAAVQRLAEGRPDELSDFDGITYRSRQMHRLIARAKRIAIRNVPVAIMGESGTGKELFARSIHRASSRQKKIFHPLNCGAIPDTLIESALFGHEKGAFTGATARKPGAFQTANGGTLFLDEIGELSLSAQVRLLRVLQENKVTRLGSTTPEPIDVRIVCATHRDLREMVNAGTFRLDLYYRIMIGVIKIPPIRHREGDLNLLLDQLLAEINDDATNQPGIEKSLSPGARNLLLAQRWPGNVRELKNTLTRAAIWTDSAKITVQDIEDALLDTPTGNTLDGEIVLGDGFSLTDTLATLEKTLVQRAWDESGEKIKVGAKLLGLPNYQSFSERLKKYGLRD